MPTVQDLDRANELIKQLAIENKILREQVETLLRGKFGRSSERLDSGQLDIFGNVGEQEIPADVAVPGEGKTTPTSEKKGHGRAPFSADAERVDIVLDVPEQDRFCACCGSPMKCIGEDISERGHLIPARMVVNRYRRRKYACPKGHGVKTADPIDGVIDRGKFEPSVYAYVATAKYSDHLPLHRLVGMLKRWGLYVSKQTMWDLLVRLDELVAQPVLKQMRAELLEEAVLHSDETPVVMRLEGGKGTRKGYAWAWRNLRESEVRKVLFEFRQSRGRDGPKTFLGKWSGTMIIDGYAGYDEVIDQNGIVRAGCWAHARRKVKKALDLKSKGAAWLLAPIQRLFQLERAIANRVERREMGYQELLELRRAVRDRRSRKLVATIHERASVLEAKRSTLPKSKLGKSVQYILNQREALAAFLDDPRLPIHNNDIERSLRHVAVGRNNWLIFASPRGGEVACRLYSLMLSCKECGADPQAYIEDVLMKVAHVPDSQIATLTPWAWAAARAEQAG